MTKKQKMNASMPVEAYEMHREFKRTTLPTGEYSGIASEELMGRETPVVKYSLDGARSPNAPQSWVKGNP